jgi:hypothetical protein
MPLRKSAPEQKLAPLPVMTTQRICRSAYTRSINSWNACRISGAIALRPSGRLRVISHTSSLVLASTAGSVMGVSLLQAPFALLKSIRLRLCLCRPALILDLI